MTLKTALLVALVALNAWAVGSLDAQRSAAQAARSRVSQVRGEQLAKRNELSQVSARIEALKAKQQGALLTGGELDSALKRSQELSTSLTGLAQQMSVGEAELESANLALLDSLTGELARLRGEFDRSTDSAARRATLATMRQVRAERESVRSALPATKVPSLDGLKPSDDPEQLLEQADLLRDNEEKLRRELKTVEARIKERRDEVELDRSMQRFMGEEAMFDDQDRRLRLSKTTSTPGFAATANTAAETVGGQAASEVRSGAPTLGGFNDAQGGGTPPTLPSKGNLDPNSFKVTVGADARPQVGSKNTIAGSDDTGEVDDLEVHRLQLQKLADQLKKKAAEFEQRAAQLK